MPPAIPQPTTLECCIKSTAAESAQEVYLLVDYTKIGTSSLLTYAHTERIHNLVTDMEVPGEYYEVFEKNGNRILIAP